MGTGISLERGELEFSPSLRRYYPVQVQRVCSQPLFQQKHPEEFDNKIKQEFLKLL